MQNTVMATIQHQVWLNAPASKAFEAVTSAKGISGWWGPHQSEQTSDGLILSHDPGPSHGVLKFKIVNQIKNSRVEWEFISRHPDASPASAWMGTRAIFDIAERQNKPSQSGFGAEDDRATVLDFRHSGWAEGSEYFGFCNFAWAMALLALKKSCEAD